MVTGFRSQECNLWLTFFDSLATNERSSPQHSRPRVGRARTEKAAIKGLVTEASEPVTLPSVDAIVATTPDLERMAAGARSEGSNHGDPRWGSPLDRV